MINTSLSLLENRCFVVVLLCDIKIQFANTLSKPLEVKGAMTHFACPIQLFEHYKNISYNVLLKTES